MGKPTVRHSESLYVLSAVPPNSNRLLRKYGLLSGIETIKRPEVLKAARPEAKQRRAFVKKVKEVIASDRPHSVMGPSVLFTPPDPEKITDKHFIKQWGLQTIRIDLGRLLEDYPDTIVWGAELLPYDKSWRKMSDDEFDEVMDDMGYASWEDFAAERSRALTIDEVYEFTQMQPEDLWEHYAKSDAGKMYASNVPHAFIITPMGYIPYEYIEYVDEARSNPSAFYTYYHATSREIANLDKDVEIFLAPDEDTASYTSASGSTYVYEVYVPADLIIFEPISVFQDHDKARKMAAYLENIQHLDEEELNDLYGHKAINHESATAYFNTRANYTDLGLKIMDACEAWGDAQSIYWTFVMSWPSTRTLGRYISCLQSFGYEGRFEQESSMTPYFEEDYSLCVFNQSSCRLGRLVVGPDI